VRLLSRKSLVSIAVSLSLVTSFPFTIVEAAQTGNATKTKAVANVAKYVSLAQGSSLTIRNPQFLMQDRGRVLAYTLTIVNNGSRELDLMDYWVRVKSKTGKIFKASPIESDKTKTTVGTQASVNITYYAVVDNSVKLTDLIFEVVKWDFSLPNYERKLGTITYGSQSSDKVQPFKDKVLLYDNTKLRSAIKQLTVSKDDNYTYLTINLLVENVGFQSTTLAKAAYLIQTENQSVYDVSAGDLSQITIQPRERRILTLQATVPSAAAAKGLSLVAAINDEASKVKLPLGLFAIPPGKPAASIPADRSKIIYLNGQTVTSKAGRLFASENGSNLELSMEFSLKNSGSVSATQPELEFSVRTKDNNYYPLTYTKEENAKLLPKIEKKLQLTGEMPKSESMSSLELIVRSASTEKEKGYLLGSYMLQSTQQQGSVGSSYTYENYSVKLSAIQRIPLSDSDMIAADLVVKNTTDSSVGIPNLSGYFLVNGVKVDQMQTQKVSLDQSITIAPGGTNNMIVYAKIPYDTEINKVTFVLTQPVQDKAPKVLYQYTDNRINTVPVIDMTTPYEISNTGRKSEVKVINSGLFKGGITDLFYTELEVMNKEVRSAVPVKLGGYVQNSGQETIPVTISEYKEKVLPNGKVLLSAWAKMPKNFEAKQLKFYLGQSIASNTGTPQGTENQSTGENGLVKAVAYTISIDQTRGTQSTLQNIRMSNYTLSLNKLFASLNVTGGGYTVEGLRLEFAYDLVKDLTYENVAEKHKLVIEVVDQDAAKATYSKEFLIGLSEGQGELLTEGKGISKSITFTDPDIQSKVQTYNKYRVNVYDVFQDTKLLVASKELNWFKTE